MNASELSTTGEVLARHLRQRPAQERNKPTSSTAVHVEGVAGTIYFAYEQLRNSADYTQRHLLLRSAIERYLRRAIYLRQPDTAHVADDLIIELTQARYISNDTIAKTTLRDIRHIINQYVEFFDTLHSTRRVPYKKSASWVYQIMSVLIERTIVPQTAAESFADVAYTHYAETIDRGPFATVSQDDFDVALYCAVHRSLLRSDQATARTYWIMRHPTVPFIEQCQMIDMYFDHPLTNKLSRLVTRYGAPMRTINELFLVHGAQAELLADKQALLNKAETIIAEQYERIRTATASSLWRMVAFVFVTKMVIGIAVEIPYNLLIAGHLAILPLVINLLFPPLYMATALLSLNTPSRGNTKSILTYIERILYTTGQPLKYRQPKSRFSKSMQIWFNGVYAVLFLAPFAGVIWLLLALGFNWVDGAVFFVFLSAVGYLRFRLLQTSREMDIISRPQTFGSIIGEFFHLPFATLGRWLSDRYQKINIIAYLLDIVIELPLKTSLRVLRQWVGFIRDKRDMM